MKALFILPFLAVITSCSSTRNLTAEEVANTYDYCPYFEFGYHLTLTEDGKFSFEWQEGLSTGTTIGTWRRKGTKVYLTSELQLPPKGPKTHEIKETSNAPSDSLRIKLVDDRGEAIPFVSVELKRNDTFIEGAVTDMNGVARLSKNLKGNLTFWAVGFAKVQFKVDPTLSYYEIELKQGNLTYKYFDEEPWNYRNGRLYPPKTRLKKISSIKYFEKRITRYNNR